MRELTVRLETVTPLLLGGADNRTPELRPPSFRGAMRYWLRATLGGVIGDSELNQLHELESAVFGSTELGSAISIRLRSMGALETRPAFILPHKEKGRRNAITGTFDLVMSQTRRIDPVIWDVACASLELALTFGGVGLRSRRGYGTLRIVKAQKSALSTFPTTLTGWRSHVTHVAQMANAAAWAMAGVQGRRMPGGPAAYPCATKSGLICLCDMRARSAMQAVTSFMSRTPRDRALGGINPRQASPLWVRPIQTGPTEYGLLCVVLASEFRGSDYRSVRDFLDRFHGQYVRVKGWNE